MFYKIGLILYLFVVSVPFHVDISRRKCFIELFHLIPICVIQYWPHVSRGQKQTTCKEVFSNWDIRWLVFLLRTFWESFQRLWTVSISVCAQTDLSPVFIRLRGGLGADPRGLLLLWRYNEDVQRGEDRVRKFRGQVVLFFTLQNQSLKLECFIIHKGHQNNHSLLTAMIRRGNNSNYWY